MSEAQAQKTEKKVKIKLLRDAAVGGEIKLAGTVCTVDEEEAKLLCDTSFDGYIPAYGYLPDMSKMTDQDGRPLPNPLSRQDIRRATRVK